MEFSSHPRDFLLKLYANLPDDNPGCLEVRGIGMSEKQPKGSVSQWFDLRSLVNAVDEAIGYAVQINADGWDCFYGVNPRVRGGQRDCDVVSGVAAWSDIDGIPDEEAAAAKAIEADQPLPIDAAVITGGGLHLYWFMKEPYSPGGDWWTAYCNSIRAAARYTGGDKKCTNVSRVLRFPGSKSWKRGYKTKLWLKGGGASAN